MDRGEKPYYYTSMLYYSHLDPRPSFMNPRVSHLFRKIRSRQAMEPASRLEIIAGQGIAGDASLGRAKRQILLISCRILSEFGLEPGELRENIAIEDLDVDGLAPGSTLTIGSAQIEIIGPCEPCARMEEVQEGLQARLNGKRGVLGRAITDGQIATGDPVAVNLPNQHQS